MTEMTEAKELMRFAVEMCDRQARGNLYFVFEQPLTSRAWALESVMKLAATKDVITTEFHQCMYGLTAHDHLGSAPAYKRTRILTNHPALA